MKILTAVSRDSRPPTQKFVEVMFVFDIPHQQMEYTCKILFGHALMSKTNITGANFYFGGS